MSTLRTGENDQGLKKVTDLTRAIGIALLITHFYYYCYGAFEDWGYNTDLTDRFLNSLSGTGIYKSFHTSKLIALGLLTISLLGARGKKGEKYNYRMALCYLSMGMLLYFGSYYIAGLDAKRTTLALWYMGTTVMGFILCMTGGTILSRIIHLKVNHQVFNTENETFPQEQRLLANEYSVNLPTVFQHRGKRHKGWINIINPFRATLVMGSPGSGKTYFVIQHFIRQHMEKGFSMFIYDYKYPDLTTLAYNQYLKFGNNRKYYNVTPQFFSINFDQPEYSHGCNCLDISAMRDITDAGESARTIMLGLNPEWIEKQGDFWVESSVNFLTAIIWFLCKHEKGRYCSLPHVVELAQQPYDKLFSVLRSEPEVEVLIAPFVNAFLNDARNQLEGQVASATIALSRLSSPQLYYVLSRDDFKMDIANPFTPKIVCLGNNPQKSNVYGPVISLYLTLVTRILNKKGNRKCALVIDEFPTLYFNGIASFMATVRSNRVATTIGVQNVEQLKLSYGNEAGKMILNMAGNIICGQLKGEAARHLSEGFGKILQTRESIAHSENVSVTKSKSLEYAIPQSTISALSSGEFVGSVADNPDQEIEQKLFHAKIQNDHARLAREEKQFLPPPRINEIKQGQVNENYVRIKKEVTDLVQRQLEKMILNPSLKHLLVKK
ncbi:conjugal transfer protein MobC [Foetidibacter luteolus]|uniref:conjugal transfer protein MobC n=1 Tax=Foetidibacter luteolus TaxID=2608880 RepID=UPI001A9891EC|nr:conjugal transfer protein MobC [Foetidibacter luteolus]